MQRVRPAPASADALNNLGSYSAGMFADEAPGALDVMQVSGGLADAEAQSEFFVQLGVRKVEIATLVEAIHDGLVERVAGTMAKTDEIQRRRRGEFKLCVVAHPRCELLREFDVAADVMLQAFDSVVANHEP